MLVEYCFDDVYALNVVKKLFDVDRHRFYNIYQIPSFRILEQKEYQFFLYDVIIQKAYVGIDLFEK
jgi:hypothetical protein